MQQMAYSGYSPQQTIAAPVLFANSLLPMVPGSSFNHYFVTRQDFQMITGDKAAADYLQDLEVITRHVIRDLRDKGRVPDDHLPDPGDLYIASSPHKAEERTLNAWGHTKYSEIIPHLVKLGFIKTRWVAPLFPSALMPHIPENDEGEEEAQKPPQAPIFFGLFDNKPYIEVLDKDGNYKGIAMEEHNIVAEGHSEKWMIRREFLVCLENVQAAQYALAGLDPPEPMKRWKPLTRQRNPVLSQKPGEEAHIRQDQAPIADIAKDLTSPESVKEGNPCPLPSEGVSAVQDSTDSEVVSRVGVDFGTNVPINSAISNVAELAETFYEAPWSTETIIGLAQSRHRPGLFECTGSDEDYDGAEKLDRLMLSLGLSPTQFWPLVDQHIMAMMDGEIWWAKERLGDNLRFGLPHVAKQWSRVEQGLKEHPYTPLDTVPYFGPLQEHKKDYTSGYLDWGEQRLEKSAEPSGVSDLLEKQKPAIEQQDVQGEHDLPGETEQQDMYHIPLPAEEWSPPKRGMDQVEYDALCSEIWNRYPTLSLKAMPYPDGSLACGIEHHPGDFMRVRNAIEWRRPPASLQRAVKDAVAYGRTAQGLYGMGLAEYGALHRHISLHYPSLSLGTVQFDDGSYGLIIEHAEDVWTEPIRCEAEWYDPPQYIRQVMQEAMRYGKLRKFDETAVDAT